jgi:hypothetical protein
VSIGWQAVIVGLLAALVGLAEIVTRYRSDPGYAVKHSLAAWLYIGVNALAGVAALYLVRAFGWKFGHGDHTDLWRILVSGFGSVALFRSSLFVTKVGGSNVGVGPSLVLSALLDAFDRDVDRRSAKKMSSVMHADRLEGLDPERVMTALPVLCLALMQNFSPSDQALLGTELVKTRHDNDLSPQAKMRATIVQLAKYLGTDLVECVLDNAREVFEASPDLSSAVIERIRELTSIAAAQQGTEGQDQPEAPAS